MPPKIVEPFRPECCLCACSERNRLGQRCAHVEPHRYCAEHAAAIQAYTRVCLCNAHAKHTFLDEAMTINASCANQAAAGTTVCGTHGANTTRTKAKARSRVAKAKAFAQIEVIRQQRGLGVNVSAIKVIQLCLDESAFWLCEWRDEVHRLSEGRPGRLIHENIDGDLSLQLAYLCLTDAIAQAAKIAKLALDAGIQERQQKLDEERTGMIGAAILAMFAELGVDEARARPVLARHLRALAS